MRPLLSICIATYNRAELLDQTLTHLKAVCGDDVEIVISDNASPDDTQGVIAKHAVNFRHFQALRQEQNVGALLNFHAALVAATGRYMYPLSDDDEIHYDNLRQAVAIMEEEADMVAVYGGYEEWDRKSGITNPQVMSDQRADFSSADRLALANTFSLIWYPVYRTDIFQRACFSDARSFGFWEIVNALLRHGRIAVTPLLFYRHAMTEPRMEYQLIENWYHDMHRASFEIYFGRMGPAMNRDRLAAAISYRTIPAYAQGTRFAVVQEDYLAGRHFMLRSRAYGATPEATIMQWEEKWLTAMVAQRLRQRVGLRPSIKMVLFEDVPSLTRLRDEFARWAPTFVTSMVAIDPTGLAPIGPNDFLVTETYRSSWFWSNGVDTTRIVAASDLIESCRLTDQPLAL